MPGEVPARRLEHESPRQRTQRPSDGKPRRQSQREGERPTRPTSRRDWARKPRSAWPSFWRCSSRSPRSSSCGCEGSDGGEKPADAAAKQDPGKQKPQPSKTTAVRRGQLESFGDPPATVVSPKPTPIDPPTALRSTRASGRRRPTRPEQRSRQPLRDADLRADVRDGSAEAGRGSRYDDVQRSAHGPDARCRAVSAKNELAAGPARARRSRRRSERYGGFGMSRDEFAAHGFEPAAASSGRRSGAAAGQSRRFALRRSFGRICWHRFRAATLRRTPVRRDARRRPRRSRRTRTTIFLRVQELVATIAAMRAIRRSSYRQPIGFERRAASTRFKPNDSYSTISQAKLRHERLLSRPWPSTTEASSPTRTACSPASRSRRRRLRSSSGCIPNCVRRPAGSRRSRIGR